MSMLKEGDTIIEDKDALEQHVLHFFSSLYASNNNCEPNELISSVIPSLVKDSDNDELTCLPTDEEIK